MLIVIHKFLNRIFKATLLLATIGLACHQLGLFIRSYCAKGSPTSDESSPCRGLTGGAKRGEAWRRSQIAEQKERMNFSAQKQFVRPPQRGIFPLDHYAECKPFMKNYLECLKDKRNMHHKCRDLSKNYLQCRMDRELMAQEDLEKVRWARYSRPMAWSMFPCFRFTRLLKSLYYCVDFF